MRYQVSKPSIGPTEQSAIARVLETGMLGMGPEVAQFEKDLGRYLSTDRDIVCVSTGTSALHLACEAIGLGAGDEVLVPSLTFVASFQAVAATGARPIACDVALETGLLNLQDAERRLTKNTKAILYVHYASQVGPLGSLYEFAHLNGLRVIEDAAHSFGCSYRGMKVGSFGDVVCFSFDPIKNITSIEGGAVITPKPEEAQRIRRARRLGLPPAGATDFDVSEQGWRYHMGDCGAAVGRAQLVRLDSEFAPHRQALARQYDVGLSSVEGVSLVVQQTAEIVPHIYPIRITSGKRERVEKNLAGIGCQTTFQYKPNHLHTMFRAEGASLPNAEQFYSEVLCLPLHLGITLADVERIATIIRQSLV